jgi:RNA polymerase sigma factor (TIGR02999 family)
VAAPDYVLILTAVIVATRVLEGNVTDVTLILNALERGDDKAIDRLLPAVYEELRQLAAQKLSHERPGHTLQATALVHEAYLRLIGANNAFFKSRAYFFRAAAEAMRRILIENARRKQRLRHGGKQEKVDLSEVALAIEPPSEDLIVLDKALTELAKIDQSKADIVKLRYFAGLTLEQAAEALDISPSTAQRRWIYAKAWLFRRIRSQDYK